MKKYFVKNYDEYLKGFSLGTHGVSSDFTDTRSDAHAFESKEAATEARLIASLADQCAFTDYTISSINV